MDKFNGETDGRKKVAIYARVSTGKQDSSLEEQIRILEDYCLRNNYYIYRVYSETASGSKDDRVQFQRLIDDVKSGEKNFDTVVVLKLDRFSRSLQSLINNIEFLKDHNINFISLQDNIETTTPTGKLMFHIIGALAEFERSLIRERTKIGMERARREGILCNRPKKEINIDRAIALYNSGVKVKEIAKIFDISTVTLWKRLNEAGAVSQLNRTEKPVPSRYPNRYMMAKVGKKV